STQEITQRLKETRSHVDELVQRVEKLKMSVAEEREQLRAGLARERQLVEAMRARELGAAQNMSLVRSSLARMRQGAGGYKTIAEEEVALLAEIDRLHAAAEEQGQTFHRNYDAGRLLSELRAGKVAVVPFSIDALLDAAPGARALILTAPGK